MPASISSVTTMGFSNGTFSGSIALVVTLGYGIGAAVVESVNYSRIGTLMGASDKIGTLMGASDKIGTLYGNDHT